MLPYIARRLLYAIPTLIGVTFVVFISVRLIPGDPAVAIAGERATPQLIAQVRQELGLDQPILTQYGRFMVKLVQGDLGTSLRTRLPVAPEVWRRLKQTLLLATASLVLASAVGMFLGIVSATRPYSLWDNAGMVVALLGVSTPVFWLGLMLIMLFSVELPRLLGLGQPIFPPTGSGTWRHVVMPAITLAAYSTGIIARMTRSAMLDVVAHDYIRTARAKGVPERRITYRHALRNALVPVITVQGLQFGTLLGGAVLTESVFAWPGLGRYLVDAIFQRDYPVVQAAILVIAIGFIIINLVVDLLYALVDPRIRYG
ncbi:MAG: peptide ABC transporter permease [Firmicutes bacterium ZCTH02-B6]|nr:MAG: peptide ABC transporter permease [Firmicutes bacterium ZCTH02-B6]